MLTPAQFFDLDGCPFLEIFVPDEDVWTVIARDEAEALGVVEPLHCTFFHLLAPDSGQFPNSRPPCL